MSQHVDIIPGDRANSCRGLMPTIALEGADPNRLDLVQQCLSCGHIQRNRQAPDDDKEKIFLLLTPPRY